MKNELGIEVKCENCLIKNCPNYKILECRAYFKDFKPTSEALIARIKELQERVEDLKLCVSMAGTYDDDYCKYLRKENAKLQEQQFTKEELLVIKQATCEYSEMSDFDYKPILKKIEQTLKNSEEN